MTTIKVLNDHLLEQTISLSDVICKYFLFITSKYYFIVQGAAKSYVIIEDKGKCYVNWIIHNCYLFIVIVNLKVWLSKWMHSVTSLAFGNLKGFIYKFLTINVQVLVVEDEHKIENWFSAFYLFVIYQCFWYFVLNIAYLIEKMIVLFDFFILIFLLIQNR